MFLILFGFIIGFWGECFPIFSWLFTGTGASSLTHWGRDKMDVISHTTFSNAFYWMKMYEFRLRFHWSLFPKVQINNIPAMVQIMVWRRPGDKPLSEPMVVSLPTHICVIQPQWVNALTPGRFDSNSKVQSPNTCCGLRLWAPLQKLLSGATEHIWWLINIFGSGKGLLPAGNKPLPGPILTQVCAVIWCY